MSQSLLDELRLYWTVYRPKRWLFENRSGGPIASGTAQSMFAEVKQRAGVTRGHGIHSLRHSFATHRMEGGVPEATHR